MNEFSRGDIWLAALDPVRGREQAGTRPVVIVSADEFNSCPAGLVIVVPFTKRERGVSSHVRVDATEAGLKHESFSTCEQMRSISKKRLLKRMGNLGDKAMSQLELSYNSCSTSDCRRVFFLHQRRQPQRTAR